MQMELGLRECARIVEELHLLQRLLMPASILDLLKKTLATVIPEQLCVIFILQPSSFRFFKIDSPILK